MKSLTQSTVKLIRRRKKSEIDDYAIPDEPDSYAVNRKAAELRYIKPIDYADRVAAMDEDLRDAIEILVSECSCYTPFRAFPYGCGAIGFCIYAE